MAPKSFDVRGSVQAICEEAVKGKKKFRSEARYNPFDDMTVKDFICEVDG